jgi:hypothetical protein
MNYGTPVSERAGWETIAVQPYPTPPRIGYAPSLGAAVRQAQANLRRGEKTRIRPAKDGASG